MAKTNVTTETLPAKAKNTVQDNPCDSQAPQDATPPAELARDASTLEPATTHEDEIRTLAHAKWEAAGCPPGDGIEFWLEAERDLSAGDANGAPSEG